MENLASVWKQCLQVAVDRVELKVAAAQYTSTTSTSTVGSSRCNHYPHHLFLESRRRLKPICIWLCFRCWGNLNVVGIKLSDQLHCSRWSMCMTWALRVSIWERLLRQTLLAFPSCYWANIHLYKYSIHFYTLQLALLYCILDAVSVWLANSVK